ncbi:hypothetical protein HK105_202847 [Polyrhizophydium stewartii]|uniref:Uncharacterized protein n=1 Tax=Polyrhizophydium stewartii TaxID=2732419 RepID=A0ABR4NDI9_9FUNG
MAAALGIEAASVLAWWTTFTAVSQVAPQRPEGTAASGLVAGAVLGGITQAAGVRHFPETLAELRSVPVAPAWTTLKCATGHAVFWCVYEGLRRGIHKQLAAQRGQAGSLEQVPAQGEWKPGEVRQLVPADEAPSTSLSPMGFGVNTAAAIVAALGYRAATVSFHHGPMQNPLSGRSGALIVLGTSLAMGGVTATLQAATDALLGK